SFQIPLLNSQLEMVRRPELGAKVKIPGKNLRQVQSELIPLVKLINRAKQRTLDCSGDRLQAGFVLDRLKSSLIALVGNIDLEILIPVDFVKELVQGSVWETLQFKPVSNE